MVMRALAWIVLLLSVAHPTVVVAQQGTSPRTVTLLNESGWKFRFGDAPEALTTAAFDDSGLERVSVPHTWNRVGEYALTRSAATNNKQGIGWYQLRYDATEAASKTAHIQRYGTTP